MTTTTDRATSVAAPPPRVLAEPFPLARVRLLDGPFKERQMVNARFLLLVEPDRLLAGFRAQAGLPAKAMRYGGWESLEINGHSLGHYLSAVATLFAATGDPPLLARVHAIVDELAACQAANGDGYVLPVPKGVYTDVQAGRIEANGFGLNGVWVPTYTLHKVFAGLRDAYRQAGNARALAVERRLGDWLESILADLTDAQIQEMLRAEHGGMIEVLADLSADTADPRYLQLAQRAFNHKAVLDPLRGGEDRLDGLHGNTLIPKLVGLARAYELTGDRASRTAAETFWDAVVNRRSFATGGHGESERFFPPPAFPEKLTPNTCETCNTYNMLKLTGHLFAWDPQGAHMEFAERALLNHLLANIGRAPGEFGYFLGLGSVGTKVFSTPFDAWWCCVGTGMENPARYGEWAYFHRDDTLWVNLFMASELDWRERGVRVRQDTRFPDGDTVRLTFTCAQPAALTLRVRRPAWCASPELRLNGAPVEADRSDASYLSHSRVWQTGDTLDLRLPMALRLEPLPHSGGRIVAAMFGPLLLAGVVPGAPATGRYSEHLKARGKTDAQPPVIVGDMLPRLRPTGRAFAEFRSAGAVKPEDLTFVPFHRVYEEPYAVYFPVLTEEEWTAREGALHAAHARRVQDEAATLDTVAPGFQQSEVDHRLQAEKSEVGEFQDRKFRQARGGWFSYEVAVDPDAPMALRVTYWGGEWDTRTFDVLADGRRVATETLRVNKPGDWFERTYAIPAELTSAKRSVTVRFQAHPGSVAGRVFGLSMVRSAHPHG